MSIEKLIEEYTKSAEKVRERQKELEKKIKKEEFEVGQFLYSRVNLLKTEYNALLRTSGHLKKYLRTINSKKGTDKD